MEAKKWEKSEEERNTEEHGGTRRRRNLIHIEEDIENFIFPLIVLMDPLQLLTITIVSYNRSSQNYLFQKPLVKMLHSTISL